jgi:hypothetical protein
MLFEGYNKDFGGGGDLLKAFGLKCNTLLVLKEPRHVGEKEAFEYMQLKQMLGFDDSGRS